MQAPLFLRPPGTPKPRIGPVRCFYAPDGFGKRAFFKKGRWFPLFTPPNLKQGRDGGERAIEFPKIRILTTPRLSTPGPPILGGGPRGPRPAPPRLRPQAFPPPGFFGPWAFFFFGPRAGLPRENLDPGGFRKNIRRGISGPVGF